MAGQPFRRFAAPSLPHIATLGILVASSQHHDPQVRDKANVLLAEAGYKVEGVPIPASFRRKKLGNLVLAFIVFAFALSIASDLLLGRDAALPGAKAYIESAPELQAVVGNVSQSSLLKYLAYAGVPGKDNPYTQYTFYVKGAKGEVMAIVRSTKIAGSYEHQIVELKP